MLISEIMSKVVHVVDPKKTVCDAAKLMAEADIGSLPVASDRRLVGVITDRDIALRAVAEGKNANTPVSEVMTKKVLYCFGDDDVSHVAANMSDEQVRRLPVVDRDKKLIGIVALADIAMNDDEEAGQALRGISTPSSDSR